MDLSTWTSVDAFLEEQLCPADEFFDAVIQTLWLTRGLPDNGQVVTIEANPDHARVAADNFARAGEQERIRLIVEDAEQALRALIAAGEEPFDLVFLDADKPKNPVYLGLVLRLARPGTVIIADNIVRGGAVADANSSEPQAHGVRDYCKKVGAMAALTSTGMQTVGVKGYDGFILTLVEAANGDGLTSTPRACKKPDGQS